MGDLREDTRGVIYFLEAEGVSVIKIGFTENMQNRVSKLQLTSPVKLTLLKTVKGTLGTEQTLLRVFQKHRLHGEWFDADENLREFIRLLPEGKDFSPEMILYLHK